MAEELVEDSEFFVYVDVDTPLWEIDLSGYTGEWREATEEAKREYQKTGEVPTYYEFKQRAQNIMTGVPSTAERIAEQEEIAGIFLEQKQTISSLDSILREKAAEPTTTGTLYAQPRPAGTGTNFALLIGIGLGLWLLMKMKK